MLSFKKQVVLTLLLHSGFASAIDFDKIFKKHGYSGRNKNSKAVVNHENGIVSFVHPDKPNVYYAGDRKTRFYKDMTLDELTAELKHAVSHGKIAFKNKSVDYVYHSRKDIIIAIAKKSTGEISTVYPILRFISWKEISNLNENPVYIADVQDNHSKKWNSIHISLEDLGNCLDLSGVVIASKRLSLKKELRYFDVSDAFIGSDTLFDEGENVRGSIIVEVEMDID